MKRTTRHVCSDCGHQEVRELAPVECPSCGSSYVLDDSMLSNVMEEEDIDSIIEQELGAA